MYIVHLKPDQTKSVTERIEEEGGWGHKTGIKLIYIIPSTYTGYIFGFINFE